MGYRVTTAVTLAEIENLPGLREHPGILMKCKKDTWDSLRKIPFSAMQGVGLESYVDRILRGLQRICDLATGGVLPVLKYRSEQELEANPDMVDTELLFFPGKSEAPFVLLCPGGGYQTVCSFIEGFPAAAELNAAGYNAFVLSYRVRQKHLLPKPMDDLAAAIRYLLANADMLHIGSSYAVMGFSAGGHLAAEWGTVNWGYRHYGLPAPKAEILCYPGIDVNTLHGNKTVEEMYESIADETGRVDQFCVHKNIDSQYPPTYIWQCEDDDTVSFENFKIMQSALTKWSIPSQYRIYAKGGHGLSQPHDQESDCWMTEVLDFLQVWMPL